MTMPLKSTCEEYQCDCHDRLKVVEARAEKLQRMLCDLTPGGSEFVNSPENCVAWVGRLLQRRSRIAVNAVLRRRAAEQRASAAIARAERLAAALRHLRSDFLSGCVNTWPDAYRAVDRVTSRALAADSEAPDGD